MMYPKLFFTSLIIVLLFLCSCHKETRQGAKEAPRFMHDTVIVDCNYTFEQAIEGSRAPKSIIDELELITVHYYSTDNKLHRGQILTNKRIGAELREIFNDIRQMKFPVAKVIPIVHYDWNDEASMNDNNSYSFCYRNVSYSKHARGMAFDLNPFFNPNRWKPENEYRRNVPENAVYNPDVPGTLYPNHPVVELFKSKGFFWGHNFKRNNDDHHFEKK